MYFEHACHSPDVAWSLCCDTAHRIFLEVNAEKWGMEDLTHEKLAAREKKIELLWAELIGYIYAIAHHMNKRGYTEDADRFVDILNMIVNANISDLHVQDELFAHISQFTTRLH